MRPGEFRASSDGKCGASSLYKDQCIYYIYTFFYTCIHIHSELLLTRSACIDKLMLYHEQGYCCNIGRNL